MPPVVAEASLDERYLEFRDRTATVFEAFPQLEPLRHVVFKQLLVGRAGADWRDSVKHWLRPLRHRSAGSGKLARADILMWMESRRDVITDTLLPVYEELKRNGVKVQLVSHGSIDAGPETYFYASPARLSVPRWSSPAWDALVQVLPELSDATLRRAFIQASAQIQQYLDDMQRLFDEVAPKQVVTASMQLQGGISLSIAARRRQIPSVLLQHGITQAFYTPLLNDFMLTWGESSNDMLAGLGAPRERLLTVGSPRHDSMRPREGQARVAARQALQHHFDFPDRPTMVFFSNGNDFVRNGRAPFECAEWLETVAREFKDQLNVIVRLHPNEDGSLYRDTTLLRLTKSEIPLADVLDGCDATASLCSTVLYEALLFRQPVWQFFAPGWPELADNWKHGLSDRVDSLNTLRTLCHELIAGKAQEAPPLVVENVFANHGCATNVVTDTLAGKL